jgi:hypothetical protein
VIIQAPFCADNAKVNCWKHILHNIKVFHEAIYVLEKSYLVMIESYNAMEDFRQNTDKKIRWVCGGETL